jgi:hypothetical protein
MFSHVINCRGKTENRHPIFPLVWYNLIHVSKRDMHESLISAPRTQTTKDVPFAGCPASESYSELSLIYCDSIRQQERNYFRQLLVQDVFVRVKS